MQIIYTLFGIPLGWIMWACYRLTHNYAVSLLMFTVITRLIMLPFTIKQQKSSVKMAMMKPEMEEIQKKYAKNQVKMNEELQKLYNREGYSMTAGCLPMLIQFPILFGLIDVIYKPMTHILRLPSEIIDKGVEMVQAGTELVGRQSMMVQLSVIRDVQANPASFIGELGEAAVRSIESLNLNIFGLDLTMTPSLSMITKFTTEWNAVIIVPIVAGLTSLLMSIVTTRNQATQMEGAAGASMKGMMLTMPILSTFIAFSVPAGVGIYWCFSNIVAIVQSLVMNKVYNPKEMADKMRKEQEERREQERAERIEAKKLKKQGMLEDEEKGLSQKELNRKRLAEARKLHAEKYGEDYAENQD